MKLLLYGNSGGIDKVIEDINNNPKVYKSLKEVLDYLANKLKLSSVSDLCIEYYSYDDRIGKTVYDELNIKQGQDTYEFIQNAIEKQIPKKAALRGYTCKANNTSWRSCPVCHARQHNTHKFCSQCGQALDWSH